MLIDNKCPTHFSLVYFFHGTRTLFSSKKFLTEGIKSLNDIFLDLENGLYELGKQNISRKEWEFILSNFDDKDRFKNKQVEVNGLLVKEEFVSENCVKYLDCPEIIEDLCTAADKHFNANLLNKFQSESVPYYIKFKDRTSEIKYLLSAIHYIYDKWKDNEIFGYESCSKHEVRKEDIISITPPV